MPSFLLYHLPFLLLFLLLVSCQTDAVIPAEEATAVPAAEQPASDEVEVTATIVEVVVETIAVATTTPEPAPDQRPLIVCLTQEPVSLYPYAADPAAEPIYHAIFENNITQLTYGYQPQGVEKLPSLADGDARLELVTVAAGEQIVDAAGRVVELEIGVELINAAGEVVAFVGEPVQMERLVVDFSLKPRLWADGQAVTAVDSVYSFDLAAAAETAVDTYLIERTANYQATASLDLRWTGIPGFYDDTYFLNIWRPLPSHLWADLSPAELPHADHVWRTPVGDGPFIIERWWPGDRLELRRNPAYYRAPEGLPRLDRLTFRFIDQDDQLLDELLAAACDIIPRHNSLLAQITLLLEAEANGLLVPHFQAGTIYEHIGFGINSYGGYGDNIGRPDWFEAAAVRQAVALCTNRQAMMDQLFFGRSLLMNSYVPDTHPLAPPDLAHWPYDPDQANQLLDELGYYLHQDGVRRYPGGLNGEFAGEPFVVQLATTQGNQMRQQLARLFQEDMYECGIEVTIVPLAAAELFADGTAVPPGPIFGRRFDLVIFGWPIDLDLACNLFMSDNIPGPSDALNPDHYQEGALFGGWAGNNYTGWVNESFDMACWQTIMTLPGTAVYSDNHQQAMTIVAQELPVIPLFPRLSVSVARPEVINFTGDATQPSDLYNIYEIDLQP